MPSLFFYGYMGIWEKKPNHGGYQLNLFSLYYLSIKSLYIKQRMIRYKEGNQAEISSAWLPFFDSDLLALLLVGANGVIYKISAIKQEEK